MLFLCLPSTVEVEHTIYGAGGVLEGAAKGLIVVDSTTADPRSTQRIGADLAKRGIRMADAPLGRTPKEAEAGKLSTFVGGDPATVRELKPIIACYADTIIEAGALGAGHTLKLVNNFIAIGTSGVIAEALATATKLGVDLRKLYDVVSAGGGNSKMFQMIMPWVLDGDDSHLKGPLRIAGKDMRYYTQIGRERAGHGVHRAGGQPDLPAREHPGPRRALHAGAARHSRRAQRVQDPRPRSTPLKPVRSRSACAQHPATHFALPSNSIVLPLNAR